MVWCALDVRGYHVRVHEVLVRGARTLHMYIYIPVLHVVINLGTRKNVYIYTYCHVRNEYLVRTRTVPDYYMTSGK